MKSTDATKRVAREIEAAAEALGFPRRVSTARLSAEVARYCPSSGKSSRDFEAEPARFRAVCSLFFLVEAAEQLDHKVAALRREVVERATRTRKLVARAAA